MPQLSKEIVDRNTAGADPLLNFKGMAVGNPGTTFYSIIPAGIDTYWGHQLISKPVYEGFVNDCRNAPHFNLSVCEAYYVKMLREVGNLNPYALDYPVCTEDQNSNAGRARKNGRSQRTWLMNYMLPGLFQAEDEASKDRLEAVRKEIGLEPVDGYEPCAEDYMTSYLNQESVKAALHVKSDIVWADCSTTIR